MRTLTTDKRDVGRVIVFSRPEDEHALAAGRLLETQGLGDAARACYLRAAASGCSDAWRQLGRQAIERDELSDAVAFFRRGAAAGDDGCHRALGCALHETGDLAGAEEAFLTALAADDREALLDYGILLADWPGREADGLAILQHAVDAGDPRALVTLGVLLAATGQDAEAERVLRQARRMGVEGASGRLGSLLAERRQFDEAIDLLREAWSDGDEDAALELAATYEVSGQRDRAFELIKQLNRAPEPGGRERWLRVVR